jgi:hypothetical protein
MARFDGSLALELDFGKAAEFARSGRQAEGSHLKLAEPNKYRVLEHRRRQAQIKARHLLQLMEEN